MSRHLAACALALLCGVAFAQPPAAPLTSSPAAPATAQSATVSQPAPTAGRLDPEAATRAYLDRLKGEARAKSDAYGEGGYWLLVWNLAYGLAVAWLLLSRRISVRMRDFAERRTPRRNLQALIFVLLYIPLVTLLTLPLTYYQEFYREHQYGLSNMGFLQWLGEAFIGLGVTMVLLGAALTGFYAIVRRAPRTWWAWGAVAGAGFMMVVFTIVPVFIAPLFNTYKPVPEGPVREEILSLARANGIPADNVFYFDASKQTTRVSANVSGMFGTTRISLNDNLLERATPAEIRAVMAHEMGHYVLNHGMKHTISFSLLLLAGLLSVKFAWDKAATRFASPHGVRDIADPAGLPLLAALLSVFLFLATPVANTIIRTAEVEADLFGLNASREPDGFSEAILKVAEYRKMHPGEIEEFLLFDHPSGYKRIFASMRWKAENMR
jgi:STE24 endopeptidase